MFAKPNEPKVGQPVRHAAHLRALEQRQRVHLGEQQLVGLVGQLHRLRGVGLADGLLDQAVDSGLARPVKFWPPPDFGDE